MVHAAPATTVTRELLVLARRLAQDVHAGDVTIEPGKQRGFVRLVDTPAHEAWLIAWGCTAALDLHDHGGSQGAINVVDGQLVELYTDPDRRHSLRSRRLGRGRTVAVPATRVHEVANPSRSRALSVHVYSPPLTSMTFYDSDPTRFMAPLRALEPAP